MAQAFKLPDLGEGIHEGEIVSVLVSPGDPVQEGQPILVVETDKATVEIPSPFTGVVSAISVEAGEVVHVGQLLMTFESEAAEPPEGEAVPAIEKEPEPVAPPPSGPPTPVSEPTERPRADASTRPVPASPATRRLAREMGVNLRQVSGSGPAGLVTAEDVRKFAATPPEAKPEAAALEGAAPEAAPSAPPPVAAPVRPSTIEAPSLPDFGKWGPVEKVPLRSVRRATAKQMALSWSQIPHVTHQEEVDITELEAFRREHKKEIEAEGGRLTLTVFALKAVVSALKGYPRFNASLDPDTEEIIIKHYFNVGVAVDTEKGLVVPVVHNVDRKSIRELAIELHELGEKVRGGKADIQNLQGGTFTITNIGPIGGTGFTPIINYPQVAILGMGQARLQPVIRGSMDNYQILPRLIMPLVLAFDHRVLDGADAARFANTIISCLQDPDRLLMSA